MGKSSASGRNRGNVASNEAAAARCRERFINGFNERYAHYFDFVGGRTSSKGKATIRCRACGYEFEKTGSFVQCDVNIYCPRCHTHRDDVLSVPMDGLLVVRLAEMYESGMTVLQIADATGVTEWNVRKLVKASGIELDSTRYASSKQAEKAKQREALRKAKRTIQNAFDELRQEIGRRSADKVLKAAADSARSKCKSFSKTDEAIRAFAPTWAVCRNCGRRYLFFPSGERYGRKKPSPYCSRKCSRKANKTSSNISSRLRKYGRQDEPRDHITLDEVIKRDNGICYICGCMTTKDDHSFRNGWFTVGDTYPTIEHVVPIARGGTHTWDNVRLACHGCNRKKRDIVA